MLDSIGGTSYVSWNTKPQSNDDSETRTFQRTKSAQVSIFFNVFYLFKIFLKFYCILNFSVLWMMQQRYYQNRVNNKIEL